MAISQLSVFIENKKGQMADVIKRLSDAQINLRAMSVADTKDFGILRLIVSDAQKAKKILGDDALVKLTDVIAVKMDDIEGALYTILKVLDEASINVEYSYAFTAPKDGAYVVFRVDDVDRAQNLLTDKGFRFLESAEKIS